MCVRACTCVHTHSTREYIHACVGDRERLSAGSRKRDSALGESVAHIQALTALCNEHVLGLPEVLS